jgi:multiple sugar transport system substrate-binding protein
MKRAMLITLILALAVSFVGWAGGAKEDPKAAAKQDVTLKVWMKKQLVAQQNSDFEARTAAFAKLKGIKVATEIIAYEDIFPKWTAAIASGDVPDVSFFGYQEVGQFAQQGVLADVTDLVAEIQKANGKIYESSVGAVTFSGRARAVPFWGEGTVLYIRKDMLAAAGITKMPDTWDEFREVALKVTDPAKGIYGAGIGYGQGNSDAEWLSRSMIWGFGGSIFDQSGKKIVLDSPESREAITWISNLFLKDKVTPPTAMGWNDAGNNTAYLSGQAAMVVNTGSIVMAMKKDNPALLEKTVVTPLPRGKAGRFTAGISNNLAIFEKAKNKALANEIMLYLFDKEWYRSWINQSAPLALPVYQEFAASDPIWKDPYNKALIDTMGTFKFLGYKGDYSPAAGKIYNKRLINALFGNVITNKMPLDQALAQFTKDAEAELK